MKHASNAATKPPRKGSFDPLEARRRALVAKVHVAKTQLGLVDDDYRAVLLRETGKMSAGDMDVAELTKVVEAFGRQGFTTEARPKGPRPADHPAARKARAMWISLYHLGAIDNAAEAALEAFARRQLGVDRLQWADQARTYRLIEALKAIAERHGWSQDLTGVKAEATLIVLKRRLVEAILAQCFAAGLIPTGWDLRTAAYRLAGIKLDAPYLSMSLSDLDLVAKALGAKLREARGGAA